MPRGLSSIDRKITEGIYRCTRKCPPSNQRTKGGWSFEDCREADLRSSHGQRGAVCHAYLTAIARHSSPTYQWPGPAAPWFASLHRVSTQANRLGRWRFAARRSVHPTKDLRSGEPGAGCRCRPPPLTAGPGQPMSAASVGGDVKDRASRRAVHHACAHPARPARASSSSSQLGFTWAKSVG